MEDCVPCFERTVRNRSSNGFHLPPRLRFMPLCGSPPASCWRRTTGSPPAYSSSPLCCLLCLAAGRAEGPSCRPAAPGLHLAAVGRLAQRNRARTRSANATQPDRGRRRRNRGRRRSHPHHTHPSHAIHSAFRQYHAGRTERESGSARCFRGWPPGGRRPARYYLRSRGSAIPCNPLRRPDPRPDRYASARALSRPRGLGCHRVAAPAGHRRGGLAQGLRPYADTRPAHAAALPAGSIPCSRRAASA